MIMESLVNHNPSHESINHGQNQRLLAAEEIRNKQKHTKNIIPV